MIDLVAAACCTVAAHPGVTRITVVTNRRLDFDELVVLRGHALACATDFAVSGNGTVVVRSATRASQERAIEPDDRQGG